MFRASLSSVIGCALASVACFPAPLPMRAAYDDHQPTGTARCLVVFIPGIGDSADSFASEGFVRTVRESGLSVDIAASDATLGYYLKNRMPSQLYVDVIAKARARHAYAQTWVMGVSFGGLGTLMTARDYPSEVTGVFAMAPYLGRQEVLDGIRKSGGLASWQAPAAAPTNEDNYDSQVWRFLKEATAMPASRPRVYLGWGKDDRLGGADQLLADALPEQSVYSAPGGHDWKTWNGLLSQFLKRGPMARSCK